MPEYTAAAAQRHKMCARAELVFMKFVRADNLLRMRLSVCRFVCLAVAVFLYSVEVCALHR